jgi:hypothetical protein
MASPGRPPGSRSPAHGLRPPAPAARGKGTKLTETEKHAKEVQAVARGMSIVEPAHESEKRPPAFESRDLLVVRSWLTRRPLEPKPVAPALVQYPRLWTSKRGRYCKFKAPGAGSYALLRARPTF